MMVICEQWSGRPKCARCSHSPGDHSITFLIAPARWLIKSVFIVHAKRTYNGWYFKLETGKVYDLPLPRVFDAILAEDFPFVKSHIQLHQASVYDCDSELNTLLDYATISRDPTITSYLVDRGAHADSLHELGCSPNASPRSPPKSLERGTFSKLKTFLKQRLWRALRPKLRDGFYQVTWTCPVCNKSLYDTLETKDAESTESFSRLLKGIQETVTLVQHPKPTFDPSGSRSRPIIYRNNSGSAGQGTALPRGIKTSQIGEPPVPRFLELCLNAGNSCQTVGEVTLTGVQSDSTMFSLIKLKLRSMRASRALQLKFGRRLFSKLVKVKFVKFGLEPTGGESAQSPKAHIFEEPSYPTAEDVSSQRWHCDPVPKTPNEKPMPSSVFIHYLLYCDGPPTDVLLKRLPKKLRLSLLKEAAVDDQLLMAWGMQLIEGPDKAKIVAFMISVLVICIGPLVVYIFLSHGIATASGVASVFVAVVTLLWMAMRVYQDQED
ncbi:hypothetical protein F4780DRAFT_120038 [Xylariomycetidae sp. FL0641]|nr:hypothetical protein F4780DRAFT_120038 [Xylariomycetidae sp. FL0641]